MPAAAVEDAPAVAPQSPAAAFAPGAEPAQRAVPPRVAAPAALSGTNLVWRVFANWLRGLFSIIFPEITE